MPPPPGWPRPRVLGSPQLPIAPHWGIAESPPMPRVPGNIDEGWINLKLDRQVERKLRRLGIIAPPPPPRPDPSRDPNVGSGGVTLLGKVAAWTSLGLLIGAVLTLVAAGMAGWLG